MVPISSNFYVHLIKFHSSIMNLISPFYYEKTRGICSRKLLRQFGEERQTKISLYPYEGWGKPVLQCHWTIKTLWWSKTRCIIIEQNGHRKNVTKGHMKCLGNGQLEITGQFQRNDDCCFRLTLSSNITDDDVHDGYVLSGILELGSFKNDLQLSHFAVVSINCLVQQQQNMKHNPLLKTRNLLLSCF
ncbi:unnamed protein product [Didymodactylos carnosus]|uniref:Uncharacterized protein n=1 Tax=Didymodactylos carnosus TaxID=1234261 RepID=A0A813S3B2_9BILA|nr:unnamed protein product [Didymodactylos carnosus]CAF0947433.1 unnamed protein product [Didymodactylos carnosus]CAF3573040.1 unnamed protein product [Didymodactylos carnosus]CAF3721915.1 unnamed protein product [Didymodactylos carnosus]